MNEDETTLRSATIFINTMKVASVVALVGTGAWLMWAWDPGPMRKKRR